MCGCLCVGGGSCEGQVLIMCRNAQVSENAKTGPFPAAFFLKGLHVWVIKCEYFPKQIRSVCNYESLKITDCVL